MQFLFRSAAICFLSFTPAAIFAATPEAQLLRVTPKDSTFCLVVRDLRGFAADVWNGPFAEAFRKSNLGKTIAKTPEFEKVEKFVQQVPTAMQVEWSQIRDRAFGDAIVLAYQNGPPGKPDEERGLVLTWVRDPKLAARLIDRLNAVQKESGELRELQPVAYRNGTYFHRIKSNGAHEYYVLKGSIFAFSSQQSAIRNVVDLGLESPSADRELPPLAKELARVNGAGFATLWINPRSFDAELENRVKSAHGQQATFLATFGQCWKAIDGIGLNCRIGKSLELDLTLATRKDGLPRPLLKLGSAFDQPSIFWSAVPGDALFAIGGRLDFAALVETISTFLSQQSREESLRSIERGLVPVFGKKMMQMLPAYLGPDFGLCITPPRSEKAVVPEILAAIRIQPSEGNRIEQSIKDALDVGATLLRLNLNAENDEPVRLETKKQGDVEVRYLTHEKIFPPGVRPSFAMKNGHLMFATDPDRILNADLSPARTSGGPNRLLIVSFRQIRKYLKSRRDGIADAVASNQSTSRNDALAQIDKFLMAIELFDRAELLNTSMKPGEMRLTLKVQMIEPFVGK